jgi:hypothetical protein
MTSQASNQVPATGPPDNQMLSTNVHARPTYGSFLDTFPPEIRNEIYKHLLCNPLLEDTAAEIDAREGNEDENDDEEQTSPTAYFVQYGLSPAILRTCRQIYEEASIILYGHNTFYFVCRGPWEWSDYHAYVGIAPLCPLTRRCCPSRKDNFVNSTWTMLRRH